MAGDGGRCERCGGSHATLYTFHFGRHTGHSETVVWPQLHVSESFAVGGVDSAAICSRCVRRARMRKAAALAWREFVGFPLFILAFVGACAWVVADAAQGNWTQAALVAAGIVGVGIIAFAIALAVRSTAEAGEMTAIELHRSALERAGWSTFWTTRQYAKLS